MSRLYIPFDHPVGVPYWHAGPSSTVPGNHAILAGQAVPRSYGQLFALWSTTWGAGDGSTTFNVPDMRGRVPVGRDQGAGNVAATWANTEGGTGGEELHALAVGEMPAHNHGGASGAAGSHSHTFNVYPSFTSSGAGAAGQTGGTASSEGTSTVGNHTHVVGSQGSGTAHNNMQPGAAGYWCARMY